MNIDEYRVDFSDFRNQFFTVEELLDIVWGKLKNKPTSMEKAFSTWSVEKKSRFIESLMLNLPVQTFYFDGSLDDWFVIDGGKRLKAIRQFIEGKFALQSLFFLGERYENCYFSDLPLSTRRKILNYKLQAYILNPGTHPQVRFGVYTNLLSKSLKSVNSACRLIIFNEGFSLIRALCGQWRYNMRSASGTMAIQRHELEDLVGHLLVFRMNREGYYTEQEKFINIEVLVNSLLMNSRRLQEQIELVSFEHTLHQIFSMVDLHQLQKMREMHRVDALLAVLSTGNPKIIQRKGIVELVDNAWDKMEQPKGYRLKDYLERYDNLYKILREL
ncbi:MAG TPA: hypothetical protein K8W04_07165 [Bacteroides reticulotermitis]|nr:hypothetical protein [Bacteroides reticulotermitis]